MEELLEKAGFHYEPGDDQWRNGDAIIECRNGKWCLVYPFDSPMHGEGDGLVAMMEDALRNLKSLYSYNRRLLKLLASNLDGER